MAAIPTEVPREARAGDTLAWTRTLPDFSAADGWVLKYQIIGVGFDASVTAEADGGGFRLALLPTATAAWSPGIATLVEYVTKGDDRHTIAQTALNVLPNLVDAGHDIDLRSAARAMLETIEGWMRTRSPAFGSVQYGDRRIDQYDPAKLLEIRSRLKLEVASEVSGRGMTARVLVTL